MVIYVHGFILFILYIQGISIETNHPKQLFNCENLCKISKTLTCYRKEDKEYCRV